MTTYPDRRGRYQNANSWDAANVVTETVAERGAAPRDNFRVVTAEPPRNPETEWVQNLKGEWVQEASKASKPEVGSQAPTLAAEACGDAPIASGGTSTHRLGTP